MQVIKKVLLILYTLILGFIVFCNTSVFGADSEVLSRGVVRQIGYDFDGYFLNCQENFDYFLLENKNNNNAYSYFYNWFYNNTDRANTWHYYTEPVVFNDLDSTGGYNRGYRLYIYSQSQVILSSTQNFGYADFQNYNKTEIDGVSIDDRSLYYTCFDSYAWWVFDIYNFGNSYRFSNSNGSSGGAAFQFYLPIGLLNYSHNIIRDYNLSSTTGGQLTTAINNQTNTIKNESAKVTSAITNQTQATKEQTNALLDTNNTGNETMSVNDTTTDTSADLTGIYNSISSAFTTEISANTTEDFTLTLPNGDNHTFSLKANILTSILNNYPVLKVFYQAFFYVVFCGYVIFDFKRIINKLKEGDIDNVVGSSNPVDSVVNMSLK